MTKSGLLSLLAVGVLWALPALALDLHGARAVGILGEKNDGYVTVLKSSADADALAAEVNAKRKQEYARISKENGQPAEIVAKLAAPQIVSKLTPGNMYQDDTGAWQKK